MSRPNRGPRLETNQRGLYEIRWTEAGRSKRSSTGTAHLQSAEKVLGNFLLLDQREKLKVEAEGAMLVCAALGDRHSGWQKGDPVPKDYWHEHVLPNVISRETAQFALDKLHRHFGHIAIADLMPDDVTAYVHARRAGKIGKPSINHTITRELSVLNAAINHAVKAKRLSKSDQPFIQTPGTSEPRDRWLSEVEADRLLAAALQRVDSHTPAGTLPRVYRFVALALFTASRKGALLGLKRDQIDLPRGIIRLNPAGRAQTNKRRPPVPISDELRPILERTLAEIPDKPNAFVLDHGGAIRTAFAGAVSRAGLGSDVTPHVLRHTWGTWAAQAGISMFDIGGVMGDDPKTVSKTYAHHNPDYLRSAVNNVRRSAHATALSENSLGTLQTLTNDKTNGA